MSGNRFVLWKYFLQHRRQTKIFFTFLKRFNQRLYSSSLLKAMNKAPSRPSSTVIFMQNALSFERTSSTLARWSSITHGFVFASGKNSIQLSSPFSIFEMNDEPGWIVNRLVDKTHFFLIHFRINFPFRTQTNVDKLLGWIFGSTIKRSFNERWKLFFVSQLCRTRK